jgi:hypothetical protein
MVLPLCDSTFSLDRIEGISTADCRIRPCGGLVHCRWLRLCERADSHCFSKSLVLPLLVTCRARAFSACRHRAPPLCQHLFQFTQQRTTSRRTARKSCAGQTPTQLRHANFQFDRSDTTTGPPARILVLQVVHQRPFQPARFDAVRKPSALNARPQLLGPYRNLT